MPKLITLLNNQLRELLSSNGLDTSGTKHEMVVRLTQYFGGDEIDAATLNELSPNNKMQEEIAAMGKMMQTLMATVKELGVKVSTLNTREPKNESPTEVNEPDGSQNEYINEAQNEEYSEDNDVVLNELNENISVADTDTRYQFNPPQSRYSLKEIAETIPEFDPTKESSLAAEQKRNIEIFTRK